MRQRIEAVLKRYIWKRDGTISREMSADLFTKLVADLLTACQPSREELEKILTQHEWHSHLRNSEFITLVDLLMAWASGTGRTEEDTFEQWHQRCCPECNVRCEHKEWERAAWLAGFKDGSGTKRP